MLLDLTNTTITNKCFCEKIITHELSELKCEYLDEFQAFSNVNLKCKECGTVEIINMNLDINEDLENLEIPEEELNARKIALELKCEYLDEFQAFSNVNLKCKECGTVEIINMNLDVSEDLEDMEIPEEELNARKIALELKHRMEQNSCLNKKEEKEDLNE